MLKKSLNLSWQRMYALAVFMLFGMNLLGKIVPVRFQDIYNSYYMVLIPLLLGVYLAKRGFSGPAEIKLFMFWLVWALLTRWMNRDFYLFLEFDYLISCVYLFLFFTVGIVLDRRERDMLLDVFSLVYIGFFTVVAIVGILVFISNTYVHVPPEDVWFAVNYDGLFYPNFLSSGRLHAAPRFLVALALLVYQFAKHKNKFFRVIAGIAMLALYTAIALCHARTTQIAMSVVAAMLGVFAAVHLFKQRSRLIVFFTSSILAVTALVCCYKGCDMMTNLVSKAHSTVAPAFEQYYSELDNKINPEYFGLAKSAEDLVGKKSEPSSSNEEDKSTSEAVVITAHDDRKLIGNWSFTERVEIWVSGIVSILREPVIGIRGLLNKQVAPTVNVVIKELFPYIIQYKINMHNAFLQVLMVTGVPGFVMVVLWTVLMVKKMVKVFFSKNESVTIADKLLTLPIAGFFVVNLAESFLFCLADLCSIAFYVISGVFLGIYYDKFSE